MKNYKLLEEIRKIKIPNYTLSEEIINSLSHGIAAAFSICGLVLLIIKASNINATAVSSVTIFGTTMILLYTMSCIYHALSPNILGKKILRIIDHCNVFLLVFGTIIPVALIGIKGVYGWIFFCITAITTLIGIFFSCINIDKVQLIEVICHLLNGWSVIFFSKILLENIGIIGLILIILGGVMYTIGAILYGIGSKRKYIHSIFHFFCIFGTILHYISIYKYVL